MTGKNTPRIAEILRDYNLDGIPEAHCYLKVNENYLDATSTKSSYDTIAKDLLIEQPVSLEFLNRKQDYHREFLENWKRTEEIQITLETLWDIREQCIQALSDS
jgi:hypothetical protein